VSVNFHTVYGDGIGYEDGDTEPWEMECDECGERIDSDHYYDMVAHDEMHYEDHERERLLAAKGGPRHRA
jgi:hypothetical protein